MRDNTMGSAPATAAGITIEELRAEGPRARGTATRLAPAGTMTIRAERWKTSVSTTMEGSTAAARKVHTTIPKITGGTRAPAVRPQGATSGQKRAWRLEA